MQPTYRIVPADPHGHRWHVTLEVEDAPPEVLLRLPAWIPGSYMIREFARHLRDMTADCGGRATVVHKRDKDTWAIQGRGGLLRVRFEVYAFDRSVRTSFLDGEQGFFNASSVFPEVLGHDGAYVVHVSRGDHPATADWRVHTTLPRTQGEEDGPGAFLATTYEVLLDHPFQLGTPRVWRCEARGIPHTLVLTGPGAVDAERLMADVQSICEVHLDRFGPPAPFDRYLFLLTVGPDGYGGLEHRDSTALIATSDSLPAPGDATQSDAYIRLLGLISHEYFHAWNVKRMKPASFVPYDLTREAYTRMLWAYEGITSYYDDLALLHAGRIDEPTWLRLLGETATAVERNRGRMHETLEEASFDAWTKYYRADEDFHNSHVSYYQQGALAALTLDLAFLRASRGAAGLSAFMKAQWDTYGDGRGVPEGALEALAERVVGEPMGALFDRVLRSTEALPLDDLLGDVGLRVRRRARTGDEDRGGVPREVTADSPDLGLRVGRAGTVEAVEEGAPGWQAGVSVGDRVLAVDHHELDPKAPWRRLRPGVATAVHVFRRQQLLTLAVTPRPAPETTLWFEVDPQAPPEAHERRARWLARPTAPRS
jgi:predicted metalloprotease with PDZ domain